MMSFVFSTYQFWIQLSDNITFSCTLLQVLGMLADYSSNRFIQRLNLVVLHVSITLVVTGPASSVDVFYTNSVHVSTKRIFN